MIFVAAAGFVSLTIATVAGWISVIKQALKH